MAILFFSDVIQSISAVSEQNNFDLILQTAKTPEEELEKCAKKIQKNDPRNYYFKLYDG